MSAARVLAEVADALERLGRRRRLLVGFSGGVDSSVLLHAIARLRVRSGLQLRAVHVHHGLRAQADAWAEHCARTAAAMSIDCSCVRVDVDRDSPHGEEAAARQARLDAFRASLVDDEVLCLGHHADDQAETVLIQLLRGAGPRGMSAMPSLREFASGWMLRPLLRLGREPLLAAAREWQLAWVEDDSNQDRRFLRSRVRHELMPMMRALCPPITERLCTHALMQAEAARCEDDLAEIDLAGAAGSRAGTLSRERLATLSSHRRRAMLRTWLRRHGLGMPGRRRLLELERQLIEAKRERSVCIAWNRGEVRSDGDDAHALSVPPAPALEVELPWDPRHPLELPGGVLTAEPRVGQGLRVGGALSVASRRFGERCRVAGRAHRQRLKELLRVYRVPPWERPSLPLVLRDGRVAAVADLFVCEGEQAGPGEPGLVLRWRRREASSEPDVGGMV